MILVGGGWRQSQIKLELSQEGKQGRLSREGVIAEEQLQMKGCLRM